MKDDLIAVVIRDLQCEGIWMSDRTVEILEAALNPFGKHYLISRELSRGSQMGTCLFGISGIWHVTLTEPLTKPL
jgi:hypothetical protein